MSNLVKMRSPTGEVVEVSQKNATDLKQHHKFVYVGSAEDEADKEQTALAHGKRAVKNRDQETAERLNKAKPEAVAATVEDKPKNVGKKPAGKAKVEKKAKVEDAPKEDASIYDDGFDDLEDEENQRGNRGDLDLD